MDTTDVTIEILKGIRDEVGGLRGEMRGMNTRLDETNGRLATLERRQVESEIRLSTELVTLIGAVREMRDAIRDDRVSRVRVEDHERRIVALEKRKA